MAGCADWKKKKKIGHLWGLQAEGERVLPRVISGLQFYNKRRGRGRVPLSVSSASSSWVVQLLKLGRLFATPWTAAHKASLTFTISQNLLKLMSIKSVMPSNHLILCPLLLLPSIFPSIRVFSDESLLFTRWPKYWSFNMEASVLPMNIPGWSALRLTDLVSLLS